jgi:hypothetical protein
MAQVATPRTRRGGSALGSPEGDGLAGEDGGSSWLRILLMVSMNQIISGPPVFTSGAGTSVQVPTTGSIRAAKVLVSRSRSFWE